MITRSRKPSTAISLSKRNGSVAGKAPPSAWGKPGGRLERPDGNERVLGDAQDPSQVTNGAASVASTKGAEHGKGEARLTRRCCAVVTPTGFEITNHEGFGCPRAMPET
jgi:hypothetical protein